MKIKKFLLFFCSIVLASVALFAKKSKPEAAATDLYSQNPLTLACQRLVNSSFCASSLFRTSGTGQQATLKSNGGTQYPLFEDSSCSNPVYFN